MFKKITAGFVIQTYNNDGDCTKQEFIAGDQCDYENDEGYAIDEQGEKYQPYHMVQPESTKPVVMVDGLGSEDRVDIPIMVEGGLIQEINIPEHLSNVVIVVKDYDTDGQEEDKVKEDEYGTYTESEWRYTG